MAGLIRIWDKSRPPAGAFTLNKGCQQAQGLVAWYPFGSSGPNTVFDMNGQYHLTGVSSPIMRRGNEGQQVRLFDATSQYFFSLSSPVLAAPISLSAWFYTDNDTITRDILNVTRSDSTADRFQLQFRGSVAGDFLGAISSSSSVAALAVSSSAALANVWNHGVARFTLGDDARTASLNGVTGTTETTSIVPSITSPRIGLGAIFFGGAYTNFWSGMIGESAIWNRALQQWDIDRLYYKGSRYELWYPLRSPKWISIPAVVAGGFQPAWASQRSRTIGAGVH